MKFSASVLGLHVDATDESMEVVLESPDFFLTRPTQTTTPLIFARRRYMQPVFEYDFVWYRIWSWSRFDQIVNRFNRSVAEDIASAAPACVLAEDGLTYYLVVVAVL